MAASPEVMQALQGGGTGGNQTPEEAAPEAAPAAAPMMTPQKPAGLQEKAKVQIQSAIKVLEMALPAFGSGEEGGKAILKAITALGKAFGKDEQNANELMGADAKNLLQSMAGPGAPPAQPPGQPKPGAPQGAPKPPGM
jgi:hypothetical protein